MITQQEIRNTMQRKYLMTFQKDQKKLNEFPEIGRIVPEISEVNIREVIVYSYRLIYEISSDKIEVLALIHCKQDFSPETLIN